MGFCRSCHKKDSILIGLSFGAAIQHRDESKSISNTDTRCVAARERDGSTDTTLVMGVFGRK